MKRVPWWYLVWLLPAFFIGASLWLAATVPAGAQTQMAEGLCYRMEARRIAGLVMGYLYWEVNCP